MWYAVASHAIWSLGRTEQEALDEYARNTGDDSFTLDNISYNPRAGYTFIAPVTHALAKQIAKVGGDLPFDVNDRGELDVPK